MNDLINALNQITSFVTQLRSLVLTYTSMLTGFVANLANFASAPSQDWIYFGVQFIPAPLWGVFLMEFTLGVVNLIVNGIKKIKILVKWW